MPVAATGGILQEKVFSDILQNSQESTSARASLLKKETVAQVLSCEFSGISKKGFFTEYLLTTASYAYGYTRT